MLTSAYRKDCLTGKFAPQNPEKYRGDLSNIIYRSSLEYRLMKWLDTTPSVLIWSSEETVIPYVSPKDGRAHRYFVDFTMKVRTKTGAIKDYLIEVKPYRFTQEPTPPKRRTRKFLAEVMQWGINQAKWKAAKKYAAERNMEFTLITEKDLGAF